MKYPSIKTVLKAYQDKKKIVALTCYDALMASIIEDLGFDFILVGDSVGMVVLGYKNTIPVTVKDMIHHASAVVRGAPNTLVVVDMPFMSYQESPEHAIRNVGHVLKKTGAQAVKTEGGLEIVPSIKKIVAAGIPVMGHTGLKPQKVHILGGYPNYGLDSEEADLLLKECLSLEEAGCFAIVLECVNEDVSRRITKSLSIPTIGIGSGSFCSGQIRVINDILGLTPKGMVPRFVKKDGSQIKEHIKKTLSLYQSDVLS